MTRPGDGDGNSPWTVRPRLVYSPHYNIGFFGVERLHPFDSRKYGRAYAALRKRFGRSLRHRTLRPAGPMSREELLQVHGETYLRRLNDPAYVARALELPPLARAPGRALDWFILRPMRWAAAGTILAAREAMTCGLAINLSGGYHHAGPERGEGFCVYADAALAVDALRRDGSLGETDRVVHVDCDAHQGNGVCHCFAHDDRVFLYDQYNRAIYPNDPPARRRIDCDVPLTLGTRDAEYLALLESKLPPFLDALCRTAPPRLAIYNAGTDVVRDDPLGLLAVSPTGVLRRDRFVLRQLLGRRIPTVLLPSGGYTRVSYRLIADTVADALDTWPDG